MTTQDSQSELDDIFNEHVENIQEGVVSAIQVGENVDYHTFDAKVELRESIEAYVTTRVKEAERRGASIAASAINNEIGVDMTLNGEYYLDRHARGLAPLTTTTNGKEE